MIQHLFNQQQQFGMTNNNNNNVNEFDFDNIEFTLLDGWANQTSGTRVSLVKK